MFRNQAVRVGGGVRVAPGAPWSMCRGLSQLGLPADLFLWGAEKAALRGATGSHLGSTALLFWGLFGFPSHFLSILF